MNRIAGLLKQHLRYAKNSLIISVQASGICPRGLRLTILRWWGMECPPGILISPNCFFGAPNIRFGADCFLNRDVQMYSSPDGSIELGKNVGIGMGSMLLTTHHEMGGPEARVGPWHGKPIRIHDGCWLAARVVVLPGVTIGSGCVIAAGAVVTGDCEPNGLYAGVPARRVRDLA
jgi:maltose O-acetyltransferase